MVYLGNAWLQHPTNKSERGVSLCGFAYVIVVFATTRELVGEKSSTDTSLGVPVDELVADPQGLEDHGGV